MPPSRVILAGYAGQSAEHLYHIALSLGATVVDVRFRPRSRRPEWSGPQLGALLGGYYRHLVAWGNANYAETDQSPSERHSRIQIVDYEAGLAAFSQLSGPVILLCQCKDPITCHRFVLANQLQERGYKYEHLRWSAFPLPTPEAPALF